MCTEVLMLTGPSISRVWSKRSRLLSKAFWTNRISYPPFSEMGSSLQRCVSDLQLSDDMNVCCVQPEVVSEDWLQSLRVRRKVSTSSVYNQHPPLTLTTHFMLLSACY